MPSIFHSLILWLLVIDETIPCLSAVALVLSTKTRRRKHACLPLKWTDRTLVEEDNENNDEETGIKGLLNVAVWKRGDVTVMANLLAIGGRASKDGGYGEGRCMIGWEGRSLMHWYSLCSEGNKDRTAQR